MKMDNHISKDTNQAWLELGFDYVEALYERGEIDEQSFLYSCDSYANRGVSAAIDYIHYNLEEAFDFR